MLIYSNSFYIEDNGAGYDLDVRDAICNSCGKVFCRQEKYRGISREWTFAKSGYDAFRYCPYCGKSLYR